ncbi:MAG: site-specific DNA-methyltransferase [Verrucomicrobiae bacterium]|nr:site-specific DNA-methyltransferase [Verrucomicrobiae bacterium]
MNDEVAMAKKKKTNGPAGENVVDYRHKGVTRLNIPPAGLAARGQIVKEPKLKWAYNPHLAPTLRFDGTGGADHIEKLIAEAGKRKLNPDELAILEEAFRNHEPWLEWAGKREQQWCVADPVALHIHERISTQAILRVARRQDVERDLFADPEHEYREAVQFYKHPMDWTNRMILGDSLAVMASLARREAMAGKVQMIYMDPPYGIKYASNFQPEVGRRDVKDKDEDLTREPEMVKAYRDTWTLGVHSYLSYLRDRLLLCKELLADSGSVFVQISDENLHRVRAVMDEVFGISNFVVTIVIKKKSTTTQTDPVCDYLLWFAKDKEHLKLNHLFAEKRDPDVDPKFNTIIMPDGSMRRVAAMTDETVKNLLTQGGRWARVNYPLVSQDPSDRSKDFKFQNRDFSCGRNRHWTYDLEDGMRRLAAVGRVFDGGGESLGAVLYWDDWSHLNRSNIWDDVHGEPNPIYVVQTSYKIAERCLQMTTDPGDLVLDPTCGSGTTAYVAENWGRRWITMDVSRVALAIARQRLLTAKFDFYKLRPTSAEDVQRNPDGPWLTDPAGEIQGSCTFDCKTVPHITLKSIAQNPALDPIFDKWEPILDEKLASLNRALSGVSDELRNKLKLKLAAKEKAEGKKSITDADRRRWLLPIENRKSKIENGQWQPWEVPFDTDPDWPKALQEALTEYRKAWREKMDEVNACIAARADQEELVDQPFIEKGKVRVSGPFTMEGVIPAEESIDDEEVSRKDAEAQSPIGGSPEELETFDIAADPQNAGAYVDKMIRLLREDGVRFPDNKVMKFSSLEVETGNPSIHARGAWVNGDKKERLVAVIVGPQYGAMNALIVEEGIGRARRGGFDDLVFAAFSFDGAAQALIQEDPDPKLRIHMAQIRPDVNMGDLLKTTVSSQLFTVSGSPRTSVKRGKEGQFTVTMEGVDIYDPVTNAVRSTGAEKVAAWFLDSDYDGRCFCVCQAFFPDKSAWEKLGKALGGTLDEDAFAKLSGTISLPFPEGEHKRIAVKVIDPRGNEVLRVHRLDRRYD